MTPLPVEPLTGLAFAPFGRVIETDGADSYLINEGTTRRFHALASADAGAGGEAVLSIFRASAWPQPIEIKMLERHPLGAQAFVPVEPSPWLIVVADRAEPAACRAFAARGNQGAQVAAGIWHHPLLVMQPTQDFLVVDRFGPEDAPGANLEEYWFADGEGCRLEPLAD